MFGRPPRCVARSQAEHAARHTHGNPYATGGSPHGVPDFSTVRIQITQQYTASSEGFQGLVRANRQRPGRVTTSTAGSGCPCAGSARSAAPRWSTTAAPPRPGRWRGPAAGAVGTGCGPGMAAPRRWARGELTQARSASDGTSRAGASGLYRSPRLRFGLVSDRPAGSYFSSMSWVWLPATTWSVSSDLSASVYFFGRLTVLSLTFTETV
jgi:hypothetical protein